ncbi:uroporphyrinogen-III C-methyltransferase [Epibacterium sp. SM1979]|uniref:uroporphyrinogen-III C-methyltransferase n=1 Tax=Tritonibacter litoralis TaxID=2662264 RepID=A0A843YN76_9RHOB|nr:uroporphyrinogen-III C-methyltransferase [Tritonibacter litoralis]MQQ10087.1 uroporphyrinogen-III C-methyltransferase [Tritonibacter litoralis]
MTLLPNLSALDLFVPAEGPQGRISLVGAGPGAADLLTLRALRVLQTCDMVLFDRLIEPEVLELVNPKAEQMFVGKEVGACAWPQEAINQLMVAMAQTGKHVVRLKSGDPSIFGRADEERAAALAAGIAVEIIPGITAASAAAATLGQSLTSRGLSDRVVFATGTCREGDTAPDIAALLQPGTSVALYMATRTAEDLRRQLLEAGFAADMAVQVVASASKPGEAVLHAQIGHLPEQMHAAKISHPAIIFLRAPKKVSRETAAVALTSAVAG